MQKFRKTQDHIMIEGQRDSEPGEIDGREETPWLQKKESWRKEEWDKKSWDGSGKKRACEETDVTLTKW